MLAQVNVIVDRQSCLFMFVSLSVRRGEEGQREGRSRGRGETEQRAGRSRAEGSHRKGRGRKTGHRQGREKAEAGQRLVVVLGLPFLPFFSFMFLFYVLAHII